MSLYADYIQERESKHILENELGFTTYTINDKECYLVDMFIKKEYRKSGIGRTFVDEVTKIAKENGCSILTTTVCPRGNGSTVSLKAILACGFELDSSVNNLILFKKEI